MIFLTSHQVRTAMGLEAEGRSASGRTKCVIPGGLYAPETFEFAEGLTQNISPKGGTLPKI